MRGKCDIISGGGKKKRKKKRVIEDLFRAQLRGEMRLNALT